MYPCPCAFLQLLLKATATAAEAVKELGEHETLSEISVQDKFSDYVDLMKVSIHCRLQSVSILRKDNYRSSRTMSIVTMARLECWWNGGGA